MKKYSYAIITGETAYYYHNLTDIIPSKIILATRNSNTRIHDKGIKQIRMKDSLYELGKTEIVYEGATINIYDSSSETASIISKEEKIKIFMDYFKGRDDAYPYLSIDKNNPNIKYYIPACVNK